MRPDVVPWWEQAQANLNAARVNQAASIHFAASWFAQQAAELALKALYIEQHGALAPKTHDLMSLGSQVHAPHTVDADLALLDATFDVVRYPLGAGGVAPVNAIDAATATRDVAAAEKVVAWIATQLP